MKLPRISVLMPNYNHSRYLVQAIGGVLAQDYSNFELVIHDDGSTDSSRQIIAEYAAKDNRVRPLYSPSNIGGLQGALKMMDASDGELLCFTASDDFLSDPSMLADFAKSLVDQPTADYAFGKAIEIHGESRDEDLWPYGHAHRTGLISGTEFAESFLKGALLPNTFTAVYRREAFKRIGGFDVSFGPIMDTHAVVMMGIQSGAVFIDKVYSRMRIRKGRYGDSLDFEAYISQFGALENEIRRVLLPTQAPVEWYQAFRNRIIEYKLRTSLQVAILKEMDALMSKLDYWKLFYLPPQYQELKGQVLAACEGMRAELVTRVERARQIFVDQGGTL